MRIRVGDPLEIFTDNDDQLVLKKYSSIGELSCFSSQYAEVLSKTSGYPVLISDRDCIISSYGISKENAVNHRITEDLYNVLEQRKPYITVNNKYNLYAAEGFDRAVALAVPILVAGDIDGAVVLLQPNNPAVPGDTEIKLASATAAFLAKHMEQ